jgi:hypothetical protein
MELQRRSGECADEVRQQRLSRRDFRIPGQELFSQLADISAPALHDDDLQAVLIIKVHVGCGEHLSGGMMLGFDELF